VFSSLYIYFVQSMRKISREAVRPQAQCSHGGHQGCSRQKPYVLLPWYMGVCVCVFLRETRKIERVQR
jgi:hypothetical protein